MSSSSTPPSTSGLDTPGPPAKSSSELAQTNTDLAVDRTLMAADRSLMAWIRTALSMISFGYTIYKVLEGFQHEGSMQIRAHMPRNMGLFLTGLGTAAMLMGTTEYWMRLKSLRRAKPYRLLQPSLVMALVMSVAGLFIFLGIVFRTV
jgi:putative membrane protein